MTAHPGGGEFARRGRGRVDVSRWVGRQLFKYRQAVITKCGAKCCMCQFSSPECQAVAKHDVTCAAACALAIGSTSYLQSLQLLGLLLCLLVLLLLFVPQVLQLLLMLL